MGKLRTSPLPQNNRSKDSIWPPDAAAIVLRERSRAHERERVSLSKTGRVWPKTLSRAAPDLSHMNLRLRSAANRSLFAQVHAGEVTPVERERNSLRSTSRDIKSGHAACISTKRCTSFD